MKKININAKMKQLNDKSKLTLIVELTAEQKDLFVLENGVQPTGMITIIIKEV